jgi:hypothetical protein
LNVRNFYINKIFFLYWFKDHRWVRCHHCTYCDLDDKGKKSIFLSCKSRVFTGICILWVYINIKKKFCWYKNSSRSNVYGRHYEMLICTDAIYMESKLVRVGLVNIIWSHCYQEISNIFLLQQKITDYSFQLFINMRKINGLI